MPGMTMTMTRRTRTIDKCSPHPISLMFHFIVLTIRHSLSGLLFDSWDDNYTGFFNSAVNP